MDRLDLLLRGLQEVPNPKYKPGSKRSKEPATILQPLSNSMNDIAVNVAIKGGIDQYSIDSEQNEKYREYGLDWRPGKDMDTALANAQSNWSKAANMLGQTLYSELFLGTIKAATDMVTGAGHALAMLGDDILSNVFDVKGDKIQNTLGMEDNDFSNPISRKLEEWQDYYKNEVAPIYTTPGVDIQNGGFGDFGWWMSNMPSIMSSLTLLIPAKGATMLAGKAISGVKKLNRARKAEKAIKNAEKGVNSLAEAGATGRAAETAKELNAFQKRVYNPTNQAQIRKGIEIGTDALLMRTIENYQESHQTYTDMYKQAGEYLDTLNDTQYQEFLENNKEDLEDSNIDINDRDAVAKHIAKRAADRTFAIDYSNTIFDVIQLYALRDIGKVAKNIKSNSVKRLHRKSIENAAKSSEQIAEEAAKKGLKSTRSKVWNSVKDFATGTSKLILSEASEGVEEAVNYIAQQEGITYGNTLLGKETDATLGGFWNKRLMNYLGSAELQESAFWGVMGGVVFGAAGTAFNKAKIYKQNKKLNERRKELGINMPEGTNDWISMSEMPEIRAAKEAINRRASRLSNLQADLKTLIDEKKNPLARNPETGEAYDLKGDDVTAQQERIKQELIERYRTEMALDAINSGTFDMLVDYFRSNEVKQAMVNNGIISQEEADSFINQTVNDLYNVQTVYNNELAHVNYQVSALNSNKRFDDQIPIEYVQQIAKANVDKKLAIQSADRQINRLEKLAASIPTENITEADIANAKQTIRLSQLIDVYGRLQADKKAVEEDPDLDDWIKAESLDDIKIQEEGVIQSIRELYSSPDRAASALMTAIRLGSKYVKVAPNDYRENREAVSKTDEEIIKEYEHLFKDTTVSQESIGQIAKTVESDIQSMLSKTGLYQTNRRLFDIYANIADLETTKGVYSRMIDSTQSQILRTVDVLHNRNNQLRKDIIAKAEKTIRQIHTKYLGTNEEAVEQAVIKSFFSNKNEAARIAREGLTGTDEDGHSDAEKLIDALNIINFSQGANRQVFNYIADVLSENAERYRKERENSITSENQSSAQNNSQTINNPQPQQESLASQARQQNGQPAQQSSLQQATQQTSTNIKVVIARNGEIRSMRESNKQEDLPAIKNADGSVELRISDINNKQRQRRYIYSPLFDSPNFDNLNEDIEVRIESNPILVYDEQSRQYLVKDKGKLVGINKQTGEVINKEDEGTVEPETEAAQQDDGISSTGGQEQSATPTPIAAPATPASAAPVQEESNPITAEESNDIDEVLDIKIDNTIKVFIGNPVDLANESQARIDKVCEQALLQTINVLQQQPEFEGKSIDEIEAIVKPKVDTFKDSILYIKNLQSGIEQTAGGLALAAKYEEDDTSDFSRMFTKALESFVDEYVKQSLVPKIDGRPVISLREILAICNEAKVTTGSNQLGHLFDVLRNYLMSPIGQVKYKVVDDLTQSRETIINNSTKTSQALQEERQGSPLSQRVNILDFINAAKVMNDNSYFAALNRLQRGDKLTMIVTNEDLIFKSGNVTIGNMPKPAVTANGGYVQYNQGWRTEVRLDANGNVVSELQRIIYTIFTDPNPVYADIRSLLMQARIAKRHSKTKVEADQIIDGLIQKFAQNQFIDTMAKDSIADWTAGVQPLMFVEGDDPTNYDVNYDNLFNHLLYLWDYTTDNINETNLVNKQLILKANLNTWFNKMYRVYDNVSNTTQNQDVEVAWINEGEINLISEDTENDYDKLEFVQNAVPNPNDVRLTAATTNGTIISTPLNGHSAHNSSEFNLGSTFIAVFSRNSQPDFIKAYGITVTDAMNMPHTKKMMYGCLTYLARRLEKFAYLPTQANINDIEEAIESIIRLADTANDIIPLLSPKYAGSKFIVSDIPDSANKGYKGFDIGIKFKDDPPKTVRASFRIYTHDSFDNKIGWSIDKGKTIHFATKKDNQITNLCRAFGDFLDSYAQINVSFEGIENDNYPKEITRGFIKREVTNGQSKVILDIPTGDPNTTVHQEYNSYSDLIIQNNLLRVNTYIGDDGTNFTPRGRIQRKNQKLEVFLPDTTPVGNSNTSGQATRQQPSDARQKDIILKSTNSETYNTIKTLINANQGNTGLSIFKAIKGDEVFNDLERIAGEVGINIEDLFPSNIYYDGRYNYIVGTRWNDAFAQVWTRRADGYMFYVNGQSFQGRVRKNSVVVGPRLLNMLSSVKQSKRDEGLRKLMHERLHQIFDDPKLNRKELLYEAEAIYDIFKEEVLKGNINPDSIEFCKKYVAYLENSPFNDENRIEEFIVEALTNKKVFNALNSIDSIGVTDQKETLFTKFARFIAKLFGWTINDDSLYQDLLYTLSNATYSENTTTEETTEETTNDEEVVEDNKQSDSSNQQEDNNQPRKVNGFTIRRRNRSNNVDPLANDDGAPFSALEEDEDGYTPIPSLASVQRNVLPEHLNNFNSLVDNGIVEYKCQ